MPRPLPKKSPWQARSKVVRVPAPYGGWNARDTFLNMPPEDAIRLENAFPDFNGVRTRDGYNSHSTGVGTRVDSLMTYTGPTAAKLFAASSGGKIMDVTATSTATNTCSTVFTNGQFQHTMMGTPAGAYLIVCNGADKPFKFDGSTWSTATITGCTAGSTSFIGVAQHQSRLWFIQKDTLDVWYLPSSSIGGAAQRLQLGPYCRLGGYLQAIATWTRDGGTGMDDQIAFITSKGEAVLYSGTDPTDSTLFAKVGTFQIPLPVGRRCVTNIGADIALVTNQGVVPFSSILPLSPGGAAKEAATQKISDAFQAAYLNGGTMFGWQTVENSREHMLIVNVPAVEHTTTYQFVMNTNTGAWCKFSGMNANCWSTLGDQLYFGGVNGTVYRYAASTMDAGSAAITAYITSAFTDLGAQNNKQFQMARATTSGPEGLVPGVGVHLDYDTSNITTASHSYTSSGTNWDEGDWDVFDWAGGTTISREWQTINGIGVAIAMETQIVTTDTVTLHAFDVMYEPGGYL